MVKSGFKNMCVRFAVVASATAALGLTVGCGLGTTGAGGGATGITTVPAAKVTGHVHGGSQSVAGATLQLYSAGAPASGGGYGQGSAALIVPGSFYPGGLPGCVASGSQVCTTLPQTDAGGNFSLTADYTCTPNSLVYLVASGGNPGTSSTNANLAMMAVLGPCPGAGVFLPSQFITLNEVTTVAAVYALQQFMAAPATANYLVPAIGAPGTTYAGGTLSVQSGVVGLKNAFTMAAMLADISTGASPNAAYPNVTPEVSKLYTIADILAYCVNSPGGVAGDSSNCGNLFTAATPAGGATPTDTIQAAWNIAQNPASNVATLFGYVAGSGTPFPALTSAPTDLTLAVNMAPVSGTTYGVGGAYGIAIDAYGNAWVSNTGGVSDGTGITTTEPAASVAEIGPDGSVLTAPVASFTASTTGGSYSQFTTAPSSTTVAISTPKSVAVDLNNKAWVANFGGTATGAVPANTGSLAVFNGSTAPGVGGSSAGGYYVGYQPWGVAVDNANYVYTSNTGTPAATAMDGRSIGKILADGTGYSYSTSGLAGQNGIGQTSSTPTGIPGAQALLAVDSNTLGGANGFLWALDFNTCKVIGNFNATTPFGLINQYTANNLTPTTASLLGTAYAAGTATQPLIYVGTGTGAVPNCASTITVGQVFTAAMANPYGIAIDKNNGVWIVDIFTSSLGFDGLTYLNAPTSASGLVAGSTFVSNGTLPTSGSAGAGGTTQTKGSADIVDGNNNVWAANQTAKSVVEATLSGGTIKYLTPGAGTGTGNVGFTHTLSTSTGIAIDPSGNVWVTNTGTGSYTSGTGSTPSTANSLTVLVGAAGPLVTPLSLAIKNNRLGQKP